jgi:hypothetical protein
LAFFEKGVRFNRRTGEAGPGKAAEAGSGARTRNCA